MRKKMKNWIDSIKYATKKTIFSRESENAPFFAGSNQHYCDLQTFRYQVVSTPRRFGPTRFGTKTFRHQPKKIPGRFGTKTFRQ